MPNNLTEEEIARSHRWHAVECNNLAWSLAELPSRSELQDEEMLNAAHASAFHWGKVGDELNQARGRMLLAHVHALVGDGKAALTSARQSHDYITAHNPPDWEIAFSYAILAHAAHAAGEADLHREYYAKAKELGEAIADPEDKKIFLATFKTIPGA